MLDEVRNKAKKDYLQGLKYKGICDKHKLSINTLKSWIKRYGWAEEKKSLNKKGAHKNKKGAPFNNKNAAGNPGGAAPHGNKNAETHGFFSKYLPEETLEIMQEIETKNPIDLLWENITIQYTAIVRAQRIMYVTAKEEMIKELKKEKEYTSEFGGGSETEWNFQFAWDRQATFLQAQSRAMAELRNMIKQYDELLKSGLATEEQKLRIEKLKAEVDTLKGGGTGKDQESIDEFIKATTMKEHEVSEIFEDDDDEDIQEEEG